MDRFLKPENLTAILSVRVCHWADLATERERQWRRRAQQNYQ